MDDEEHSLYEAVRQREERGQRPLRRGDVLAGRYRVQRSLGRGGMATLMLADDTRLDRSVVLKLARPDRVEQGARTQILQEKRALATLAHPSVVSIFDVGVDNGQPFLVLEHIRGRTLIDIVDEDGPLTAVETMRMALCVAEGIHALHRRGLLHLDLTAANVMQSHLDEGQTRTRIIDFGLAAAPTSSPAPKLVGTARYMAPEQILGHDVGPQADIYALGVLMYFALCGAHPFEGEDQREILKKQLRGAPERLSERLPAGARVPRRLLGLVEMCLAKDAQARFQSFQQVAEVLRELIQEDGRPAAVPRLSVVRTAPPPGRVRIAVGALALVALSLSGMGLVSGSWSTAFLLATAAALGAVAALVVRRARHAPTERPPLDSNGPA